MPKYLKLANHTNTAEDHRRAKTLRKNAAFAERLLWNDLRAISKNIGFKFRRQHPIHPFIADFACIKIKFIIELDGDSHDSRLNYDADRDKFLNNKGYSVLRFTNQDVYYNREGVVAEIIRVANELSDQLFCTPPLTPPQGEGD